MTASTRPIRCTTRALKNANFLKQMAPETFARNAEAAGFGTGIPLEILNRLHRLTSGSPELADYPAAREFLQRHKMPVPRRSAR